MAGTERQTTEQLDGLAAALGVAPASAELASGSYREAKRFLSGLGEPGEERGGPLLNRSEFFARRLPAATIAALTAELFDDRLAGCTRELDFSPWGGAYTRVAPDATAFAHRDARFLLKQGVTFDTDTPRAERAAAREWLERSWALTHPFGTGGVYPNFPEPARDDWDAGYHGPNRERLLAVKRRYDPDGVFGAPPR
jgi:FAD/FMN-containing dehydrogenase